MMYLYLQKLNINQGNSNYNPIFFFFTQIITDEMGYGTMKIN